VGILTPDNVGEFLAIRSALRANKKETGMPDGSRDRPSRIILATDFSSEAEAAEAEAVRLARALNAELILVHVAVESPPYGDTAAGGRQLERVYADEARWAEGELAERARRLASEGVPTGWRRRVGVPHEQIVKAAQDERATYIVIGSHGRGRAGRFLLGSVAERVARTAACAVVIVRPRDSAAARRPTPRATPRRRVRQVRR